MWLALVSTVTLSEAMVEAAVQKFKSLRACGDYVIAFWFITQCSCAWIGNLSQFDGATEADGGPIDASDAAQSIGVGPDAASADATPVGSADSGGAPGCSPTTAVGAIATPGGYQSILGDGGYVFVFDDRAGSTSCVAPDVLCGAGTTAPVNAADWGAAFAFDLNQPMGVNAPINAYAVPATANGISVVLSNLPSGTRISIDHLGQEYCVTLPSGAGTVTWPQFNTQCWNNEGAFLTGPPPDATFIHFIVPAIAAARVFNFCVIDIHFANESVGDGGSADGGGDTPMDGATD